MTNTFATQIDPAQTPDRVRQTTVEKAVYTSATPGPEIREAILRGVNTEPIQWIRQMEIRLLKKCSFDAEALAPTAALLSSPHPDVCCEVAALLHHTITTLISDKKTDARKAFEARLLPVLTERLQNAPDAVWLEVYKTVARFSPTPEINRLLVDQISRGDEEALYIFAQYAQGAYPAEGQEALLAAYPTVKRDETAIHILRALGVTTPKEGPTRGYPDTEPIIQTLLSGLASPSENVRREAAISFAARAHAAKKNQTTLPLENEVWNTLFRLYETRLTSTTAPDRDHAKEALRALPVTPERLGRVFTLMHRVSDELQKQNVVELIGTFKTPETRAELIKMLKVNFAGLRLEAQKTTVDAASGFVPDAEIEAEIEKLLEGKGLHADIQAKLADRLFSDIPSLKARLQRWLRVDDKTKRPALERFELPAMHIKIIEAAKKRTGDADLFLLLTALAPLLMMNDAKVKLNEVLREFPQSAGKTLQMDQVAPAILAFMESRASGSLVFNGFALPAAFGGSETLAFGVSATDAVKGLSVGASQMATDFVKKAVQDLFSGDLGEFVLTGTAFRLTQNENTLTVASIIGDSGSTPHAHSPGG